MRSILLMFCVWFGASSACAERIFTCLGLDSDDILVATIDKESGDKVIRIKGDGNLANSTVLVSAVVQLPNGAIKLCESRVEIQSGRGSVNPSYFDKDFPSGAKFLSVELSDPESKIF